MTTTAKFYAYVKNSSSDWGQNLKAVTERAAKIEARKLDLVEEAFGLPQSLTVDRVYTDAYLPPRGDRVVA